jgi:hypothetical protein
MITFSLMPFKFRAAFMIPAIPAALATLATLLLVSAPSAKSPEDFVGPAPAAAPGNQKPPAKPVPATAAQPAPAPVTAQPAPAPAKPAASSKAVSAAKVAPKPAMDTAALHATYLDGDFDKAIRIMEAALKNKKNPVSHADSVFIFKHLGVMYAATPATREKGRYYMAQLIYIEPTAKILDMYASDMIYLIFRNVQEEFANKHPNVASPVAVAAVDTAPKTAAPPPEAKPAPAARSPGRSRKTIYWVAGGAVAVGAVGLLFVLLDSPEPKNHSIVLAE